VTTDVIAAVGGGWMKSPRWMDEITLSASDLEFFFQAKINKSSLSISSISANARGNERGGFTGVSRIGKIVEILKMESRSDAIRRFCGVKGCCAIHHGVSPAKALADYC
jgi:hypothetical protein